MMLCAAATATAAPHLAVSHNKLRKHLWRERERESGQSSLYSASSLPVDIFRFALFLLIRPDFPSSAETTTATTVTFGSF